MTPTPEFAHLFDEYYPRLYSYVRSRVNQQKPAEDITAVTFERAFSHFESYDSDKGAFSTWIFSIARNQIINHLKADSRQPAAFDLDMLDAMSSAEPSPEEQLLQQEQHRRLNQAIEILSDRDQEIIQLRFFGHLTNRRIAEVMDIKEKTVSVIILRALRKLKEQLDLQETA